MLRFAAIAFVGAALGACIARDRFACTDSQQCTLVADGVCHEGACAYPDADCESRLRYGDLAGDRAGRCVEDDGVADDSSTTSGGADTSAASTTEVASESTGELDTGDDTGHIPSVCDGVACSDAGTCVVVGDEPSCACDSGYWMVGLECVLDPCDGVSCRYVDAITGDDANEGTIDAPWRTLQRLGQAFADALPGDHFLLRRGSTWGDPVGGYRLSISGATGEPDAPIVIGAYGPLADGRPHITPGNLRINGSSHVVVRDIHVRDDPDSEEQSALFGNRPCVLVQYSDHVLVYDTELEQCNARGVWISYESSYTAVVASTLRDSGNDGIAITDSFDDPVVQVGPHHWVLDNVLEDIEHDGIAISMSSDEVPIGDAKIVRNSVADSGADGIHVGTTGFAWVVDNAIARAGGINVWEASVVLSAREGGQLSGNLVFENGGNGLVVNHIARVEHNTVIHDGDVGDGLALDDGASLSAELNLVWPRAGRYAVRVLYDAAADHVVALDDQWYGGVDESACVFRDTTGSWDLVGWREATGLDLASSCGPVPGVGAFALGVPVAGWDEAFLAAFVPDPSWTRCGAPMGARGCDGAAIGPPLEPLTGFDEDGGLGWPGPLVVQQRYDVAQ
ncbi:MAG TPA: right-handed parallel beta-helix repeat-containing protein [Nannocystaceae bacterium]|nr:right-handed parallel beta-helix repeat-containing protein [Nannocystaceae bacterium]